jgi:hypothetical protein
MVPFVDGEMAIRILRFVGAWLKLQSWVLTLQSWWLLYPLLTSVLRIVSSGYGNSEGHYKDNMLFDAVKEKPLTTAQEIAGLC